MKKLLMITHWLVLIFYVFLIVDLVFFARGAYRNINLMPFDMIMEQGFSVNVWGNVLMFIPLGIYAAYYSKKMNGLKVLLFIIGSSVFIEVVQFIFKRGATDIDDVILNTLGGVIGFAVYRLIVKLCRKRERADSVVQVLATLVGTAVLGLATVLFVYNR
ncbi:VanZ family protein [Solibacillus silvestris]|uniref:VanZ family protein n=1 Tax=Solibacillus silvestris TaxID=76853 RepID=UPI003F806F21